MRGQRWFLIRRLLSHVFLGRWLLEGVRGRMASSKCWPVTTIEWLVRLRLSRWFWLAVMGWGRWGFKSWAVTKRFSHIWGKSPGMYSEIGASSFYCTDPPCGIENATTVVSSLRALSDHFMEPMQFLWESKCPTGLSTKNGCPETKSMSLQNNKHRCKPSTICHHCSITPLPVSTIVKFCSPFSLINHHWSNLLYFFTAPTSQTAFCSGVWLLACSGWNMMAAIPWPLIEASTWLAAPTAVLDRIGISMHGFPTKFVIHWWEASWLWTAAGWGGNKC